METQEKYAFVKLSSRDELKGLKKKWLDSLASPPDGMWESIRDNSIHWKVEVENRIIGYACIGHEGELLQFFLLPKYMSDGVHVFERLKEKTKFTNGVVGTNNPIFLSLALHLAKEIKIHTYLFRDSFDKHIIARDGELQAGQQHDVERIVDFCHQSTGAPQDWLSGYISNLIKNGELFVLEKGGEIIGTSEVRRSGSNPHVADIGMIVSPRFRKLGYGTFLLQQGKRMAKEWNLRPICSCEKDNIGSLKSIQNCGFYSLYQLLAVAFE